MTSHDYILQFLSNTPTFFPHIHVCETSFQNVTSLVLIVLELPIGLLNQYSYSSVLRRLLPLHLLPLFLPPPFAAYVLGSWQDTMFLDTSTHFHHLPTEKGSKSLIEIIDICEHQITNREYNWVFFPNRLYLFFVNFSYFFFKKYLFIWLYWVLVVSCGIFHCKVQASLVVCGLSCSAACGFNPWAGN